MVEKLYSVYDAPVSVRSAQGKTFPEDSLLIAKISKVEGVLRVSRAVEEMVILNNEKKRVNAKMTGVDLNFLETCDINHHIVDGYPALIENNVPCGIIGAVLLDNLNGWIPDQGENEQITVYSPLREASIGRLKNPFRTAELPITARMNFNREINESELLVPLEFAQEQLGYGNDITALYIGIAPGANPEEVRDRIAAVAGKSFVCKTAYEKNELIFKTSKTEKKIVIVLLAFIFVLAAFNLVASVNMLYIQKKEDLQTMSHFGADRSLLFRIFFFEGLLISARGILFGLILGIAVCLLQIYGHVLEMPNSAGEPFPMSFHFSDVLLVVFLVGLLSAVFSYLPVRYLIRTR